MMRLQSALLVLLTVVFCGCGGGTASVGYKGAYGQVSGKVTYDGKPVPQGSLVSFIAKDGPQYISTGKVNGNGEYTLTFNGKSNVPAIPCLVQITPPTETASGPAQMTPDQMANAGALGKAAPSTAPFPAKYSLATTSKLTFDVKSSKNTADFDLPK